jgi:hypothetical protein
MAQYVKVDEPHLQVPQWAADRYPIDALLSDRPSETNLGATLTLPALSKPGIARMEVRVVALGPYIEYPFDHILQSYDPGFQGVLLAEKSAADVRFICVTPRVLPCSVPSIY